MRRRTRRKTRRRKRRKTKRRKSRRRKRRSRTRRKRGGDWAETIAKGMSNDLNADITTNTPTAVIANAIKHRALSGSGIYSLFEKKPGSQTAFSNITFENNDVTWYDDRITYLEDFLWYVLWTRNNPKNRSNCGNWVKESCTDFSAKVKTAIGQAAPNIMSSSRQIANMENI